VWKSVLKGSDKSFLTNNDSVFQERIRMGSTGRFLEYLSTGFFKKAYSFIEV